MNDVLIIGAGSLGSRYIQGFVKCGSRLNICVVESSPAAIDLAKSRWNSVGGGGCSHNIEWHNDLVSIPGEFDLVIVATSSKGRADLIDGLSRIITTRYWVIEKLVCQSENELALIQAATSKALNVWVNTPRRMMKWHRSLKGVFSGSGPFSVKFSGGLWGLACNAIHFIDLVSWWSDESLTAVDTSELDNCWFDAKRPGFFEVCGNLTAQFSGGTCLTLSSVDGCLTEPLNNIMSDGVEWKIDETLGLASSSLGQRLNGEIEPQSKMTSQLVEMILEHGTCYLPTLDVSSSQHTHFLNAMLCHWNLSNKSCDLVVPIT